MAEEKIETEVEEVVKEPETKAEEVVKKPKAKKKPTEKPEEKGKEREYYRTKELAEKFSYRTGWISHLCKTGRIEAIQAVGGQWHIPREEYEKILKRGKLPKKRTKTTKTSPVIDIAVSVSEKEKVAPKMSVEKLKETKKLIGFPKFFKE